MQILRKICYHSSQIKFSTRTLELWRCRSFINFLPVNIYLITIPKNTILSRTHTHTSTKLFSLYRIDKFCQQSSTSERRKKANWSQQNTPKCDQWRNKLVHSANPKPQSLCLLLDVTRCRGKKNPSANPQQIPDFKTNNNKKQVFDTLIVQLKIILNVTAHLLSILRVFLPSLSLSSSSRISLRSPFHSMMFGAEVGWSAIVRCTKCSKHWATKETGHQHNGKWQTQHQAGRQAGWQQQRQHLKHSKHFV